MASRFTLDDLVDAHVRFLDKNGPRPPSGHDTREHARERLQDWAADLSATSLAPPRIVLVAEDFGPVLTNTSMLLLKSRMDLRLIRLGLHKLPDKTLTLTTSQVLPVPRADDFMIRVGQQPNRRTSTGSSGRRGPTIDRLIAADALSKGEALAVTVPPLKNMDRQAIQQWLDDQPVRARVRWRHDREKPFEWEADGAAWAMKPLVREIVRLATGEEGEVWGPNWILAPDGRTLATIAEQLPSPSEE